MTDVAELITEADGYLNGDTRLFTIDWAESVVETLKGTPSGDSVATELVDWLKTPEPHLDNEVIERALMALRLVVAT